MNGVLGHIERQGGLVPLNEVGVQGTTLERLTKKVQDRIVKEYGEILASARVNVERRKQLARIIGSIVASEDGWGKFGGDRRIYELIADEIVGFGPIEPPIRDPQVQEIMINGPDEVFVERDGVLCKTEIKFRSESHLMDVIARLIAPSGRRVDQSSPYCDARLPDGSRVNVIIPPLAVDGPTVTIRKFGTRQMTCGDLVKRGTMTQEMAEFLARAVRSRLNIIITGGASSGKTSTLNALSEHIDPAERVITIEDSAELRLTNKHVVRLETRPTNFEGRGEVTMRDLLRNALRMRPDRIIIGEVRGEEAFELLQALNTGHAGSLSTLHANGPEDAVVRFSDMVMMAGSGLPYDRVRRQVLQVIDLVVHLHRNPEGHRYVRQICATDGVQVVQVVAYTGNGQAEFFQLPARLAERMERR